MPFYCAVALVSLVLLPVSYRRSGSMIRYRTGTGAPVIWPLLGLSSVVAVLVGALGGADTARHVFTGGLIGTALTQVLLLRGADPTPSTAVEGQQDAADRREDLDE